MNVTAVTPEPHANRAGANPDVTGRLAVDFASDATGRTFLRRQYAGYPFHVCKLLYQDTHCPGLGTLYAQSCSGGIYQDDHHSVDIVARPGAQAHVTTQASTIVHSMPKGVAIQDVRLVAEPGAYLEFLPDPQILFPESCLRASARIAAGADAVVVFSDSFLCHDPQGAGRLPGSYRSEITVTDDTGRVLAIDRLVLDSQTFAGRLPGVLGAFRAQGTLMLVSRSALPAESVASLQRATGPHDEALVGMSELPNGAGWMFRILAADGLALRRAMHACWHSIRCTLKGHAPMPRRK